ncbi:expressed unknown protein [Seminavis robusta]|uniref:Uncharacterized protein n=1 Tax=Seminavis robusta TaxID=568900 RepID=A0A9N8HI35_9STRA|nr:expressed unknown protein [Seminavis robusta]|eukprot:Sro479_g151200.1 n/a (76) ;mRNA; f:26975-27367
MAPFQSSWASVFLGIYMLKRNKLSGGQPSEIWQHKMRQPWLERSSLAPLLTSEFGQIRYLSLHRANFRDCAIGGV